MKEKLTREVVEALAKCNSAEYSKCENCLATKICINTSEAIYKRLSEQLLEEMDKPKVWDGAPENAHTAMVVWYREDGSTTHSQDFTRELPKTRARIMAEEIASAKISNEKDLVDIIEQTINTHVKELKGEA